jgi:hypothetical protein
MATNRRCASRSSPSRAAGLLDALGERPKRRIRAEQIGEELRDRVGAERQERKLLVMGPPHPRRVVLGTEVEQQETTISGGGLDQVLGLPGAARAGEPADDVEELTLPRLGPHGWDGSLRIRNPEEVEYHRQAFAERLVTCVRSPSRAARCFGVYVHGSGARDAPGSRRVEEGGDTAVESRFPPPTQKRVSGEFNLPHRAHVSCDRSALAAVTTESRVVGRHGVAGTAVHAPSSRRSRRAWPQAPISG